MLNWISFFFKLLFLFILCPQIINQTLTDSWMILFGFWLSEVIWVENLATKLCLYLCSPPNFRSFLFSACLTFLSSHLPRFKTALHSLNKTSWKLWHGGGPRINHLWRRSAPAVENVQSTQQEVRMLQHLFGDEPSPTAQAVQKCRRQRRRAPGEACVAREWWGHRKGGGGGGKGRRRGGEMGRCRPGSGPGRAPSPSQKQSRFQSGGPERAQVAQSIRIPQVSVSVKRHEVGGKRTLR